MTSPNMFIKNQLKIDEHMTLSDCIMKGFGIIWRVSIQWRLLELRLPMEIGNL